MASAISNLIRGSGNGWTDLGASLFQPPKDSDCLRDRIIIMRREAQNPVSGIGDRVVRHVTQVFRMISAIFVSLSDAASYLMNTPLSAFRSLSVLDLYQVYEDLKEGVVNTFGSLKMTAFLVAALPFVVFGGFILVPDSKDIWITNEEYEKELEESIQILEEKQRRLEQKNLLQSEKIKRNEIEPTALWQGIKELEDLKQKLSVEIVQQKDALRENEEVLKKTSQETARMEEVSKAAKRTLSEASAVTREEKDALEKVKAELVLRQQDRDSLDKDILNRKKDLEKLEKNVTTKQNCLQNLKADIDKLKKEHTRLEYNNQVEREDFRTLRTANESLRKQKKHFKKRDYEFRDGSKHPT
jgi:FtsZ-binding cell division protein ZapB